MKITIFIVVFASMQTFALDNYAQTKRMDVKIEESGIVAALEKIEAQSEFFFFYNNKVVKLDKKISVDLKNKTINEILDALFKDTDIEYTINNRQIILSGKEAGNSLSQQQKSISGKVTDSSGGVLPGVTVAVRGTTNGTITDANGKYSLANIPDNATLQFSFVGKKTQEIPVAGKTSINVVLAEEAIGIEEVVAVGYGTVKKVNLTGSVTSVSSNELLKRPVSNVQNLLQGKATGLEVIQSSGQPGSEGATMRVRGLGTFSSSGSSPMVLIDGVQGDLTSIDPENVESISVLKDAASAAIYGSRAANGVILVTTKHGKAGSLNIEYKGNFQIQQATRMPNYVTNSADYQTYYNQANERMGVPKFYSQETINAFKNATDRTKYPNFNWVDFMVHNAQSQNHHLSINGGNGNTTYNFSLGYMGQDGIITGHDYKRVTLNFSIDSKVNDRVSFGASINAIRKDIKEPQFTGYDLMLMIYTAGPDYGPYLPDGSGRYAARYSGSAFHNRNPLAAAEIGGTKYNNYNADLQGYIDVKLAKSLKWQTKGAVNFMDNFTKKRSYGVDEFYWENSAYAMDGWPALYGVDDNDQQSFLTTFYSTLNFAQTFKANHNLNALIGYNQESYKYRYLDGSKIKFPVNYLNELDAGGTEGQIARGSANEWAIQSLFGRVNYDFKGKYLFETNFRYDGTSRISKDGRWGLFPSVSAGWRISKESFMSKYKGLDNLKLRASWGQLGNQNIGLYPYQDMLYLSSYNNSLTSYTFDQTNEQGVRVSNLTDKNLKWETTTVTDFGLDFSIKNGLLSLTADWFNKKTDGILYNLEIPTQIGLTGPTTNYGKMKNTGYEFELSHNYQINDFKYGVSFNLSTYKNEVLKIKSPSTSDVSEIKEGLPWNSYYLTEWIGIFQSQQEIDSSPTQPYNPKPGDLKFKDQNNDGKIDAKDRIVVDGRFPAFTYGGTLNLSWKNFDLNAFFQGVAGQKVYVNSYGVDPFIHGSAPTKELAQNAWTEENKTNKYPALYGWGYGPVTGTPSTYYLQNNSYLRLKNLNIGYNLPSRICSQIGMKNMRVYISGDNLLTFTKYPGADPESASQGAVGAYPQLRIFTAGLSVKF